MMTGTADDIILRVDGLTKRFGTLVAVDRLTFGVRRGEVLGFLGPNGAGKSTTLGMILGLIAPTAGTVTIFGQDLATHRATALRHVGAVIENPALYPYLSGRDNLRALAVAMGGVPDARVDELLALVGLTERAESKFKTYSLGMKQRLGIASTLLGDPELIMLDEPTNGLDPAGQREIRDLVPRLAREGRGVLLASHLLHEVEQVCDRVLIVRRGQLVESGPVRELLRRESFIEISIDQPERAAGVLQALPFVSAVQAGDGGVRVAAPEERGADLNRALVEQGLYARTIVPRGGSLEALFMELTEPAPDGRTPNASPAAR